MITLWMLQNITLSETFFYLSTVVLVILFKIYYHIVHSNTSWLIFSLSLSYAFSKFNLSSSAKGDNNLRPFLYFMLVFIYLLFTPANIVLVYAQRTHSLARFASGCVTMSTENMICPAVIPLDLLYYF